MNFDLISFLMGGTLGAAAGYFVNYSRTHSLQETLGIVRDSSQLILNELMKERALSAGMQEELAVQAKVLPATK